MGLNSHVRQVCRNMFASPFTTPMLSAKRIWFSEESFRQKKSKDGGADNDHGVGVTMIRPCHVLTLLKPSYHAELALVTEVGPVVAPGAVPRVEAARRRLEWGW